MLTASKGTYENGQIILDETPPFTGPTRVIVTFLEKDPGITPDTFANLYPYLHRWVEMDGRVEIGYDSMGYTNSLVMCHDEGDTVYMSPPNVTDIEQALQLANTAIHDWLEKNMSGELTK